MYRNFQLLVMCRRGLRWLLVCPRLQKMLWLTWWLPRVAGAGFGGMRSVEVAVVVFDAAGTL